MHDNPLLGKISASLRRHGKRLAANAMETGAETHQGCAWPCITMQIYARLQIFLAFCRKYDIAIPLASLPLTEAQSLN